MVLRIKNVLIIYWDIVSAIIRSSEARVSYEIDGTELLLLIEKRDNRFFKYIKFKDSLILPTDENWHFKCPNCNAEYFGVLNIAGQNQEVSYNEVRGDCTCFSCNQTDSIENFIYMYTVEEEFILKNLFDNKLQAKKPINSKDYFLN